ncbi:MAG: AMP-binding protein [Steroidobacteraceae bacterium]|jgi:long-chain acyl-CoA synthetase|nr:long-chain-fatty-acid--CoA ligase [Gammaproteobacteria bacterium]
MTHPWLASYPPGVPAQIDPSQHRSIGEMADSCFEEFASRTAYLQMGRELTYGELDCQSKAFGAWLQARAGLAPGDRVAIMLPNILQYPIALFGVLRAGGVVVNTNPLYTPRELEHQLNDSGAEIILILENFAHVLEEVIARTGVKQVIVTSIGELLGFPKGQIVDFVLRHVRKAVPKWNLANAHRFSDVLREGSQLPFQAASLDHDDLAFLQYTGGTTGVSKGAMLSHGNMVANVLQSSAWIEGTFPRGEPSTAITALPLYHIFALTANCLLFLRLGWTNVLITNPRDFPGFVAELKKHRFTYISGVNTLFNALLHTPGFEQLDFSSLRCTLGGGMAVQRAVAERWKAVTGCILTQAWGLTETSPAACINPPNEDFNDSIGLPISSTEIAIVDDDGKMLELGATGEICVRGPQVMQGYYNRPEETAKVMLANGWLRTGDIGHMDPRGYVYIEDRKKDMINVSGFNVYPNEVESVAVNHPGIIEAAAVAKADEKSGEAVALFVVRKDPSIDEQAVIAHCRESLTGYKVPKFVYFRDELPKTNVGKILRRELRDAAQNL